MSDEIDQIYFRRRAAQERVLAAAACDGAIRLPHLAIAIEYERRGGRTAPLLATRAGRASPSVQAPRAWRSTPI